MTQKFYEGASCISVTSLDLDSIFVWQKQAVTYCPLRKSASVFYVNEKKVSTTA